MYICIDLGMHICTQAIIFVCTHEEICLQMRVHTKQGGKTVRKVRYSVASCMLCELIQRPSPLHVRTTSAHQSVSIFSRLS